MLKIHWDFPTLLKVERDDNPTVSSARMFALSREDALARLSAKDRRPLLILRECNYCKGTEKALLSTKLSNERTLMLAQWFHCVKFKPNVLDKSHTFRKLFAEKKPAHLLLCAADGSARVGFNGRQMQTELWKAMEGILNASYERSASKAIKQILGLMNRYDCLDDMRFQLEEQVEAAVEDQGPRSLKSRRLRKRLQKVQREYDALKKREAKIRDLHLRKTLPARKSSAH